MKRKKKEACTTCAWAWLGGLSPREFGRPLLGPSLWVLLFGARNRAQKFGLFYDLHPSELDFKAQFLFIFIFISLFLFKFRDWRVLYSYRLYNIEGIESLDLTDNQSSTLGNFLYFP